MNTPTIHGVTTHALTIVEGTAGTIFEQSKGDWKNEPYKEDGGTSTATWTSEIADISQRTGHISFMAKSVRALVSMQCIMDRETKILDQYTLAAMNEKCVTEVTVVFVYTRHDGSEFSVSRGLLFRGGYFFRFKD